MKRAVILSLIVLVLSACGNGEAVQVENGVGWMAVIIILAVVIGMGFWILNRVEETNEILRMLQYELKGFIEEQRRKKPPPRPRRPRKKKAETPKAKPPAPEETPPSSEGSL